MPDFFLSFHFIFYFFESCFRVNPKPRQFLVPVNFNRSDWFFSPPPRVQCIQIDMFHEVWNARYIALIRIDDDGKIDPAWWKTRPIWKL